MRRTWLLLVLGSFLLAAPTARGDAPSGRAVDDADVARADDDGGRPGYAPLARSRASALTERLRWTPDRAASLLAPGADLPGARARSATFDEAFDLDRPFAFRLPALAPEGLRLDVTLGRVTAYVGADLASELPRLDCVDGETYFAPGLEVAVARRLRAFVEDFQPASGIIGGADPDEPAPARSWDGHQVAVGLRWEPVPGVTIEVAAVGHVLSATRRPASPGAMASIAFRL